MSSGITVDKQCTAEYDSLKMQSKYSYVIYKISDDEKDIIVDCKGAPDETFEDFRRKMMAASEAGQGRYAVYDVPDEEQEQQVQQGKSKPCGDIIFVAWVCDTCKIKQKMLYASSKDALLKKLVGIKKNLQANDADDITMRRFREILGKEPK